LLIGNLPSLLTDFRCSYVPGPGFFLSILLRTMILKSQYLQPVFIYGLIEYLISLNVLLSS